MATKKKPVPALKKQQLSEKKTIEQAPQSVSKPATGTGYKPKASATPAKLDFAFGKINYLLMIAGLVVMSIGFILMIGGGSEDPKVFNEAIFSTQRLTVAPILVLLGFAVEIVAILKKPAK